MGGPREVSQGERAQAPAPPRRGDRLHRATRRARRRRRRGGPARRLGGAQMTLPLPRWVLLALAAAALASGIDNLTRPLANPDEGRYSEISREMAATGDWVTPRLNGIKDFEQPPLQ